MRGLEYYESNFVVAVAIKYPSVGVTVIVAAPKRLKACGLFPGQCQQWQAQQANEVKCSFHLTIKLRHPGPGRKARESGTEGVNPGCLQCLVRPRLLSR